MRILAHHFFDPDDNPAPAPQVVIPPAPDVIQPVVDHAEKIGHMEERIAAQDANLFEQIGQVRSDLFSAIEESGRGVAERVTALEDKLASLLAKVEETPPPAAPNAAPDVVITPPAPTARKVRRNGRLVTRGK
jgi:hypothetical protein